MSFVAVAVAGASVVGAVVSSNAAKDSAKAQAGAVQQSSAQNTQLARETRASNEALFAEYLGDEAMARAYLDAINHGSGTYTPGGAQAGTQRTMSAAELQQAHPDLYALWQSGDTVYGRRYANFADYASASGVNTQVAATAGSGGTPVTITRDQVMAQIQGTPLAQIAQQDFNAREDLTSDTYAGANTLANQEYSDLYGVADSNYAAETGLAGDARTGRRGVAQSNLDSRLANNAAIKAAWDAKAQSEAAKAVDLNFSRGGVDGLVGQTRAGVAQVGQEYALDAYGMDAQLNADAYDPYYGDVTRAEDTYWGDMGDATTSRSGARTYATANRGDRRQTAYDGYSRNRAANYDTYAGDRLNSYGEYVDSLNNRAARGAGARENIAGFNSSYAASAANQNSRASEAAAAAYGRQGEIQQQLYGDLAEIGGELYGSIRNKKKG